MPEPYYITAENPKLDYDMDNLPDHAKCLLLSLGGVMCVGSVDARSRGHYVAWAPLLKRDKELEKQLGIEI